MRTRLTFKFGIIFFCGILFTGCSPKQSGFIGDEGVYSAMKPDDKINEVLAYRPAPYPLAGYDSMIVAPVSIYLSNNGQQSKISEEDLTVLAQKFRETVTGQLESRYEITDSPAPRVAILRLAITDANPNITSLNVQSGSLAKGAGLGGAKVEADLIDSVTGKRIVALLHSSEGKLYKVSSGSAMWEPTQVLLDEWAKVINDYVNNAHG